MLGIGEHMYNADFKRYHQLYLSILREFGFGDCIMEVRILQEVECLVRNIRVLNGGAFDPDGIITCSVFNVISSILFNRRYQHTDTDLKRFIELQHLYTSEYYDFMPVDFCNTLRFLPYYQKVLHANLTHKAEQFELIEKTIIHSLAVGNSGGGVGEGESFVRSLINREGAEFDFAQFKYGIRSIILGGTETSATALQWFLVYMANNKDIQTRAQQEV